MHETRIVRFIYIYIYRSESTLPLKAFFKGFQDEKYTECSQQPNQMLTHNNSNNININKKHSHSKPFSWRSNVFGWADDCQNDTSLKNHHFISIHWLFTNNINSISKFFCSPRWKYLNQSNPIPFTIMWLILDCCFFSVVFSVAKNAQFQINHLH